MMKTLYLLWSLHMSLRNPNIKEVCKELRTSHTYNSDLSGVLERIIKDVADEFDLNLSDVRRAVISTFTFTKLMLVKSVRTPLKLKNLITIRWKYIGSWVPEVYRATRFMESENKKIREREELEVSNNRLLNNEDA